MQVGYKIRDQTLTHFVTATVVDWVDIFTRKNHCDTVIECLDYCIANKAMLLYADVIMSNHIHMIAQSNDREFSALSRDVKKYTTTKIIAKNKNRAREQKGIDVRTI